MSMFHLSVPLHAHQQFLLCTQGMTGQHLGPKSVVVALEEVFLEGGVML